MLSIPRWGKFAIVLYLLVIHLLAFLFVLEQTNAKKRNTWGNGNERAFLSADSPAAASAYAPDIRAADSPLQATDSIRALHGQSAAHAQYSHISSDTGKLLIPVAGVKRKDLQDTYTQSRSGGRIHNAIDIVAAEGTPVVAAVDGEIARFFDSKPGGITIYQWDAGRKRVYYYAHLQRRAAGIAEQSFVKRGTVIGYVGNTGNAGPGNYHLHFSIILPDNPDRHWEGTDINPYPLLRDGIEIPAGRE